MTLGYRFPPGPPSEVDLHGQIALGGKMMRKTIAKMREYDIKQWEKMGKEGKMMRKTMEKRRGFDIKQWKKWESNGTFE